MPPTYRYDHMPLRSRDVKKTAEYYHQMFEARIVESIQSDGKPRTDLDLNGTRHRGLALAVSDEVEHRVCRVSRILDIHRLLLPTYHPKIRTAVAGKIDPVAARGSQARTKSVTISLDYRFLGIVRSTVLPCGPIVTHPASQRRLAKGMGRSHPVGTAS